ncbi:hypothetical protein OG389_34975 [Streptomyces sp. NBC_00435]|uniref:hypothetical protein n=1 Tax=Streptomyces sp. NBC_00435 TaxID=2903649 RepID=UPI002E1AA2CA
MCAFCGVAACRHCDAPASARAGCEMNACRAWAGDTCSEAAPEACHTADLTAKGSCASGDGARD